MSADAARGWHAYSEEHGVDVTALLEVIGLHFNAGGRLPDEAALLTQARRVQKARRVRKGTRKKWYDG